MRIEISQPELRSWSNICARLILFSVGSVAALILFVAVVWSLQYASTLGKVVFDLLGMVSSSFLVWSWGDEVAEAIKDARRKRRAAHEQARYWSIVIESYGEQKP